eukprot:scaffold8827_cov69-Phaeocystis_antarctica.AAC.1
MAIAETHGLRSAIAARHAAMLQGAAAAPGPPGPPLQSQAPPSPQAPQAPPQPQRGGIGCARGSRGGGGGGGTSGGGARRGVRYPGSATGDPACATRGGSHPRGASQVLPPRVGRRRRSRAAVWLIARARAGYLINN